MDSRRRPAAHIRPGEFRHLGAGHDAPLDGVNSDRVHGRAILCAGIAYAMVVLLDVPRDKMEAALHGLRFDGLFWAVAPLRPCSYAPH